MANFRLGAYAVVHFVCMQLGGLIMGQESLAWPSDPHTRQCVSRASDWLVNHVQRGVLVVKDKELPVSIIAWKDPTLHADNASLLAGYAITDSLWASYALSLTRPDVARELHDSLERIDCLSNALHEVIWQRMAAIHHKPMDADPVHGRSLGLMSAEKLVVDVRSFSMAEDREFTLGHPRLFAEHAVYQSLFEYRNGETLHAVARLRRIFQANAADHESPVKWDAKNGLLVDFVNETEYQKFLSKNVESCRQYSFKLATLLYACRLMGLDNEFPAELSMVHQRLLKAQLSTGGVAHFFDVFAERGTVQPCPDATGEATAMFVLAESVKHKAPQFVDTAQGIPLAIMDGAAITALRTGAASGVATDLLARHDASSVALFGAGAQSCTQLAAMCAVRSIRAARVVDVDRARRTAFAEQMSRQLNLDVVPAESSREALQGADIVCTATTSREPVFDDADVPDGLHINAVGAFRADCAEIPPRTVQRARIVVDQVAAALDEAGDLLRPLAAGIIEREQVSTELGHILSEQRPGRCHEQEITLFKSVGIAIQDLYAAQTAYDNARHRGLGLPLPR